MSWVAKPESLYCFFLTTSFSFFFFGQWSLVLCPNLNGIWNAFLHFLLFYFYYSASDPTQRIHEFVNFANWYQSKFNIHEFSHKFSFEDQNLIPICDATARSNSGNWPPFLWIQQLDFEQDWQPLSTRIQVPESECNG